MPLDPNRFTRKTQEALGAAQRDAADRHHSQVTPEHLLAALVGQPEGVVLGVLERIGLVPTTVRARLDEVNEALVETHDVKLGMRIGINTGEVLANIDPRPGQAMVTGDAVNVAARLCHRARAGEVLFSSEVATQLGDDDRQDIIALPNFSLRGRSAPVRIYCVPAPERVRLAPGE